MRTHRVIAAAAVLFFGMTAVAAAQDFEIPTTGVVTQSFYGGYSGCYAGEYYNENNNLIYHNGSTCLHRALDIGAPNGAPLYAARAGTAHVHNDNGNGYGKHIIIDHGSGWFTVYGHMNAFSVSSLTNVNAGQKIGQVGATGYVTGPHVHLEVRRNPNGSSWSWSLPRYFIPTPGSNVTAGQKINFNYPGLPPIDGGTSGTTTTTSNPGPTNTSSGPTVTTNPGTSTTSSGGLVHGKSSGSGGGLCSATAATRGRTNALPLILVGLLFLLVWRRRLA